MKKILLLLVLSGVIFVAVAQQKQSAVDSVLRRSGMKADTSLFNNKMFSQQLSSGSSLSLNQLNPFPNTALAGNLNTNSITYDRLDNMPVLHTAGNSKMPVKTPSGKSNMPVAGKNIGSNDSIIIDRKP